jgi:hypothetical protein
MEPAAVMSVEVMVTMESAAVMSVEAMVTVESAAVMSVEPAWRAVEAAAPPALEPVARAAGAPPAAASIGVSDGRPPEQQDDHEGQRHAIRFHDHETHTRLRPIHPGGQRPSCDEVGDQPGSSAVGRWLR